MQRWGTDLPLPRRPIWFRRSLWEGAAIWMKHQMRRAGWWYRRGREGKHLRRFDAPRAPPVVASRRGEAEACCRLRRASRATLLLLQSKQTEASRRRTNGSCEAPARTDGSCSIDFCQQCLWQCTTINWTARFDHYHIWQFIILLESDLTEVANFAMFQ